jgi:hypothetical protein
MIARHLLLLISFLFLTNIAIAKTFKIGETILIAFPASNIKDDAYMIGIVRKVSVNGDYQLFVTDYVEGHDYGLSCTPILTDSAMKQTNQTGWELWQDTTKPKSQQLEFIVPAERAMKLSTGKLMFIERYNIYITYSRWKSNAPIMPIGRLESAKKEADSAGISAIKPAIDIAILDRKSYYDPKIGRPYWPYESIQPLTVLLTEVDKILAEDRRLNALWRAKKRDWREIEKDMKTYFVVDALDKAVADASYILSEDGLEKANPSDLQKLKKQLRELGY